MLDVLGLLKNRDECSLSLRERAGVRGKRGSDVSTTGVLHTSARKKLRCASRSPD
jgi:hypothetical protein